MIPPRDGTGSLPPCGADPARSVEVALEQPNPAERSVSLTALLEDAQACVSYLSARRDDALRAMRINGASYGSIANVLGVSKTRAQQLVVRLERPQGPPP